MSTRRPLPRANVDRRALPADSVLEPISSGGLLVAPSSPEQLAAALGRLLDDAGLRARLCESARRTVEQRYSFAARMEKIRTIYERLLP